MDHVAPPGPISTMRPAYITATRSQVSAITPMSCVTSITAAPCSRAQPLQQRNDLRLDRHVERRGRLVGDDQLRLGRQRERDDDALAHAAGELVRVLVDALLRRPGCRSPAAARTARWRASAALTGRCVWIVSISCRPIVYSGFSEVSGSWKIAPIWRPRILRICSYGRLSMRRPSKRISPPRCGPADRAGR